jgi:hypothetical protein
MPNLKVELQNKVLAFVTSEYQKAGKPVALSLWNIARGVNDWGRGRPSKSTKRNACTTMWNALQALVKDGKIAVNTNVRPCIYWIPAPAKEASTKKATKKIAATKIDVSVLIKQELINFAERLREVAKSI